MEFEIAKPPLSCESGGLLVYVVAVNETVVTRLVGNCLDETAGRQANYTVAACPVRMRGV